MIDLALFRSTMLATDPFEHVVVPWFVPSEHLPAVIADSPKLDRHGSYPASELDYGPAFAGLIEELQSSAVARAVAEKFAIDLSGRPTIITLRGRLNTKDGRIHTDTASKLITVLIYLNPAWNSHGGKLRLLRSGTDIDDYAVEIAPDSGTLLAFRRSERSFHGHQRFVGERLVLQLNWVTNQAVVEREIGRHRRTAWMKRWLPFI